MLKDQKKYPEAEQMLRVLLELEKRGIYVMELDRDFIKKEVILVLAEQHKKIESIELWLRDIRRVPYFLYCWLMLTIRFSFFLDRVSMAALLSRVTWYSSR